MHGRRGILKALLALVLLPAAARAATPAAAGSAVAGTGFRMVNGWILTERDLAALAALGGARR